MNAIHRITAVNESRTTQRALLAAGIIGLPAGYLGFGSAGLFVAASALGVLTLASVLWTAFAPHDPQKLRSSARTADYDRKFLNEDGSTKYILSAPDSPADFGNGEAAQDDEKVRSLGISVVFGRSDPSGFKVSPEKAKKLQIIGNTPIRVRTGDRES